MKALKKIKSIASATMTIASIIVLILALCIVDIAEFKWTPFVIYFAALAWLWYAIRKQAKKGEAHVE